MFGEDRENLRCSFCGKKREQVEKDCDRDNFMSPQEAKDYGLVDEVVQSRKEIKSLPEKSSVVTQ